MKTAFQITTALRTGALTFGLVSLGLSATAQGVLDGYETVALTPVENAPAESYVGTVRASDMHGLAYNVGGCIVAVSAPAKRDRVAEAGQMLVKLDDQRSQLSLRTAEARVLDLRAAVEERQLDVEAAEADVGRRAEELEFVSEEYERNSTMFRRGLINETTMEGVERRMMDARFAAERAREAMANASSAKRRAEIAVEIGGLEQETAEITQGHLTLTAPFDGVLVGFEPRVGACVQEGALAGQIYAPEEKAVDVYVLISRLAMAEDTSVGIGAPVRIRRINGETCGGTITWIDTEADLESQYVETTIDVEEACAPELFLNEAVEVETVDASDGVFEVPSAALLENTLYLVADDSSGVMARQVEIVDRAETGVLVRLPGAAGRHVVVDAMAEGLEALMIAADPS